MRRKVYFASTSWSAHVYWVMYCAWYMRVLRRCRIFPARSRAPFSFSAHAFPQQVRARFPHPSAISGLWLAPDSCREQRAQLTQLENSFDSSVIGQQLKENETNLNNTENWITNCVLETKTNPDANSRSLGHYPKDKHDGCKRVLVLGGLQQCCAGLSPRIKEPARGPTRRRQVQAGQRR